MGKISMKQLAKKIEQENEAFKKMTKAQQRVTIAKDVIVRINCKNILPIEDVYVDDHYVYNSLESSAKEALNNKKFQCKACAKGSLFMASIGRLNKFSLDQWNDLGSSVDMTHKNNSKIPMFTPRQLCIIEMAFEGSIPTSNRYLGVISLELQSKAKDFYEDYWDDTNRLIAICENIIENDGTFKL